MTWKCKRCGECCKQTPQVSKKDIQRIKKTGIKNSFIETIQGIDYLKDLNGQCVFLKKDNQIYFCEIYDARPEICRQYPLEKIEDCKPRKLAFDDYLEKKRNLNEID